MKRPFLQQHNIGTVILAVALSVIALDFAVGAEPASTVTVADWNSDVSRTSSRLTHTFMCCSGKAKGSLPHLLVPNQSSIIVFLNTCT